MLDAGRILIAGGIVLAMLTNTGWPNEPLIVAHRGASHDAPENTLAAFRLAWEMGSDGIEGDFRLTADQQIVCIHDDNTKRTTSVSLPVESSTFAQLRSLDAGAWKGERWRGEKIPSFADVFVTVPPGKLFVIELKSKPNIAPVLAQQLSTLDSGGIKLLIISFDADTIQACKELMPDVPAHWLTSFKRSTPFSAYRPNAETIARTVKRCRADGVGFKGMMNVVDEEFVQALKEGGCDQCHVWTINSNDAAKHFCDLGVMGITTNHPDKIGAMVRADASSEITRADD